jgi:hypothetical protein
VGVLVSVDVGEAEAAALEVGDLGVGFGFDFSGKWVLAEPCVLLAEELKKEVAEFGIEAAGDGVGEPGDVLAGGEDGFSIDEDYVAAYAECGGCASEFDGLISGGGSGH